MGIRDPIRFEGTLTDGKAVAPLVFLAGIDDEGGLTLNIEPIIPGQRGTSLAPDGVLLQPWAGLKLTGRSADGWAFASDAFYIGRWSRSLRPSREHEVAAVEEKPLILRGRRRIDQQGMRHAACSRSAAHSASAAVRRHLRGDTSEASDQTNRAGCRRGA